MTDNTETKFNTDELKNDNFREDSDDDVKFLIYGGDDECDASDLTLTNNNKGLNSDENVTNVYKTQSNSNKDNSTISVSELLKVSKNSGITQEKSTINKKNNRLLNNVSNTIYIDNEDDTYSENPCKDMLMVWDDNPELRPWSRLIDVSPWFNYGFNEKTFKEYIIRQLGIRWERIKRQNIETGDDLIINHMNTGHTVNSNTNNLNNIANFNIAALVRANDISDIGTNIGGNIIGDKNNVINDNNSGKGINTNYINGHIHNHNLNTNNTLHHGSGATIPSNMPNFLQNAIYYPQHQTQPPVTQIPFPHSSYPMVHSGAYHQKHLYNNFPPPPPHISVPLLNHHSTIPSNVSKIVGGNISGNSVSNNNSNSKRGKKRPQE
ncbi:CCAAT-box DNA binding protein subunit B [Cryptosporidium ryanae]|uniref:CCAAT-box DNA binding protein subunit B n=1 Tax=Cryptosporidium ryanae TaxID=515981 RepID=UPI00351A70D0|nr:CCAAT-box DNA binding protein subunit B [Cryptosporidium ryanae]